MYDDIDHIGADDFSDWLDRTGEDASEFDGEPAPDAEPYEGTDGQADAEWLASAGMGTDEDYGGTIVEDQYLDSYWEDQYDLGE